MFSNALRTQARLALTSCRTRVSAFSAARLVARVTSAPVLPTPTARLMSTSAPGWNFDRVGRPPRPVAEPSKNVFVGNLPFSIQESELREKLEPFGEISSVRISYRPDGTSRGFAHVEFSNQADAVAAVQSVKEEPLYLLDRDLRVDFAQGRKTPQAREPTHSLYFHGFRGGQEALRQATRSFESSIINVYFIKDRETGLDTGSGFIHFMNVERATEALNELHGLSVGEETLFLRYAYPKKEDGDRRGGRDGGDRRGGRGGFNGGGRGGRRGGYDGGEQDGPDEGRWY